MMFNKDTIRNNISLEEMHDFLSFLGAEPKPLEGNMIISKTICHNEIGEGSYKLYYYNENKMFHCYTGCEISTFDIFNLVCKVKKWDNKQMLNKAISLVANYFGLVNEDNPYLKEEDSFIRPDALILRSYESNHNIDFFKFDYRQLKEYDPIILDRLTYPSIAGWEKEGITRKVCLKNKIGFYPSTNRITLPHFDIDNRFIGLRGRATSQEDIRIYGKYIPLTINDILYSHPLHFNLYNINNSKNNIHKFKKAIIFESEKSCLMYQSYFGSDADISVACCGFSISNYQIDLLRALGANEIIVAFDKQFQSIGDKEFVRLKRKIHLLSQKYKPYIKISFIFDKFDMLGYKSSPIDEGKDKFMRLCEGRIQNL